LEELRWISSQFSQDTPEPEELLALEGSIEKWRKIKDREDVDEGRNNCTLCQHHTLGRALKCYDCIIYKHTYAWYCQNTPYKDWCNINIINRRLLTPEAKAAATRMWEFLTTLRQLYKERGL